MPPRSVPDRLPRAGGRRDQPVGGWILVCAVLTGAALLSPIGKSVGAAEIETARKIRRVEVFGNQAYSDGKLRGILRTRGRSFVSLRGRMTYRPDFVRFDQVTLRAFYRRHGYLDARVDSVRIAPVPKSENLVDVEFYVIEGSQARVADVRFEGTGPIAEEVLARDLSLKPGAPVDLPLLEADRQAIENRYADLGYIAAEARDSLITEGTRVHIRYRIDPGTLARVGQIGVEGNRKTRRGFITRELLVKPGDLFARERLIQSQQRIYDTGYYSDVEFERGPIDSASHLADLSITVRERRMAWIDLGLGYGTVDQLRLTSEWGHRNVGRTGMRLSASGRLGVRIGDKPFKPKLGGRRGDVAATEPWFLGTRTQATIGGYAEEIPVIDENIDFPLRALGASFTLRRELSRYLRGYLAFENRYVISDSTIVVTPLGEGRRSYTTQRVIVTGELDTRRNLFDPKAGLDLVGNAEVAGGVLQGSTRFEKVSGNASTYIPIPGRRTLALRVRAGYVRPFGVGPARAASDTLTDLDLIPVDDRFRTGGATTVRGYFENELGNRNGEIRGGQLLLLGSVEIRFPLVWIVSAALFVDAGNVWERPPDLGLRRLGPLVGGGAGYSDMRYSAGGGLRIGTPVGPVRFDFGWKLRRGRPSEPDLSPARGVFHFSLGQAF